MGRSEEFVRNKKQLLKDHKYCQRCGRFIGLEVHHKIPLANGGTDELDNLIVLCSVCHYDQHLANRSELIRTGVEKARSEYHDGLVSREDFYMELYKFMQTHKYIGFNDILDIIDKLPVRRWKKVDYPLERWETLIEEVK